MRKPPFGHRATASSRTKLTTLASIESNDRQSSSTLQSDSVLIAIIEGRGTASEVGIACFDWGKTECNLYQFADTSGYSRTLTIMHLYSPTAIIICQQIDVQSTSKLLVCLNESLNCGIMDQQQELVMWPRRTFDDNVGRDLVDTFALIEQLGQLQRSLQSRNYALAALAALFDYFAHTMPNSHHFRPHTIMFRVSTGEGIMHIDYATAISLELVKSNRMLNRIASIKAAHLMAVIDHTRTKMGKRLLRMSILQPLYDSASIQVRQGCVRELLDRSETLDELQAALNSTPDIDTIISILVQTPKVESARDAERRIQLLLHLMQAVLAVTRISDCIRTLEHPLFRHIVGVLDSLGPLRGLLETVLNMDILISPGDNQFNLNHNTTEQQRAFSIRLNNSPNNLLEVARKTLRETQQDIYEYVATLAQHLSLPLQLKNKVGRGGYFIAIPSKVLTKESDDNRKKYRSRRHPCLPEIFCNVTGAEGGASKSLITCTTMDLLKLNERIKESLSEIFLMSDQVCLETLAQIVAPKTFEDDKTKPSVNNILNTLYRVSEYVAMLDMLQSFAEYASLNDAVCPTLIQDTFATNIIIKGGRHPILDHQPSKHTFHTPVIFNNPTQVPPLVVPNDVFLCSGHNMLVITGPNMSGKSTYLRQVALLTVMSQLGMFIPCLQASISICDALFTRLGSDDDMESNASTFLVEMREMSCALHSLTNKSLVVIDELGRGTSSIDGLALTTAICEALLQTEAGCLLATHFTPLVNYLSTHTKVATLCLKTILVTGTGNVAHSLTSDQLKFMYKVESGTVHVDDYGIKIAIQKGLSQSVIDMAYEASDLIKRSLGLDTRMISVRKCLKKRNLIQAIARQYRALKQASHLSSTDLYAQLKHLQAHLRQELEQV